MSEYKLFVQRIGLVGITNILVTLSSLILLPILTKNLTIEDYGIWVQLIATISFIPYLVNLGLPYSMVRFLPTKKDKAEIQEGFYSITLLTLFVGVIASIIIFIFAEEIAILLFNGNTAISILLSAITLVFVANSSYTTLLRTFQQMKVYSIVTLVQTYAMVFLVTVLVQAGYNIEGAAFGYFIVQLLTLLFLFLYVISRIGIKIPRFKNINEYLSFGIPTVPGNLSNWFVELSDRYVIGILLGVAYVGYYSPGYTLGSLITTFMAPFAFILPPLLSPLYDEKKMDEVKNYFQYSIKYFVLIALPSIFGLSLLSKQLLMFITTPEIAVNGYFITPFTAISAFLFGIYGIISQTLILEKKTKIIGSLWIIAAIINLVLNIIFVPIYGIIAAAVSTLIAYAFTLLITVIYSQKCIKLQLNIKFLIKSLLASILMSLIIILVNPTSIVEIITVIIICAAVYLAVIYILKGISKEEIDFIKKLAR